MSDFWINTDTQKPNCFERGMWDGERSNEILFRGRSGKVYVGHCYSGILDGTHFCDFYTECGEVTGVIEWAKIPD